MKKLLYAMIAFAAIFSFAACNETETYADMRNRELDSISAFLKNEKITVISETEFKSRFEKHKTDASVKLTDCSPGKNEYVLFESNGVYMQIVNDGCGNYIQKGKSQEVLVRFSEYNVNQLARIDSVNYSNLTLSNNVRVYSPNVDKMVVTNTSGTFQGAFDTSSSIFAQTYNSSGYGSVSGTVPSGWLVPFTWVKIGRGLSAGESIAHVRLLIPHSYGSTAAAGSVYACFYDMTLQKGK